jgi:hypothetical protein
MSLHSFIRKALPLLSSALKAIPNLCMTFSKARSNFFALILSTRLVWSLSPHLTVSDDAA